MNQRQVDCNKVLRLISNDSSKPTMMQHMENQTGFGRHKITEIIRELRQDYPICSTKSSPGGYWLGDTFEIKHLINDMRATARTLLNTADNLQEQFEGEI